MPDHRTPHADMPHEGMPHKEPRNWSEAFAALPLASPERDAWPQLARQLRPVKVRNRRSLWWSMAAALALLAALPLAWRERGDTSDTSVVAATPGPTTEPKPQARPVVPASDPAVETVIANNAIASSPMPALETGPTRVTESTRKHARPKRHSQPFVAEVATADSPASDSNDHDALQSLYAQSAQLEGLLAQVQDERVASGPAAALAGQFEARLALIDASLSQPSLEAGQRADLWRERVDALQQLVGFQGTQRWLTAQGERYDGQLVAVY